MKLYTDYIDWLTETGLLKQTLTKALKIWTCCGIAHTFDLLQPRTILEIGRFDGHSLGLFRWLAPDAHIISIEPAPRPHAAKVIETLEAYLTKQGVEVGTTEFINRKSQDAWPDVDSDITERMLPGIDFALIDGDHSYEGALEDWRQTKPRMRANGVVCFDNTEMACGQVFDRIDDFEKVKPFHVSFRGDPGDGGQYGLVFMGARPGEPEPTPMPPPADEGEQEHKATEFDL